MKLRPFGTLTIQTDPDGLYMLSATSVGLRIIQEFKSVDFEGDRLRGTMIAKSGADWLTVDDDLRATIDIRLLLETEDGAHVFVTMDGRADWQGQLGQGSIYCNPRLESGDERYQWVNMLPLVSKGAVTGRAVAHEFFELV